MRKIKNRLSLIIGMVLIATIIILPFHSAVITAQSNAPKSKDNSTVEIGSKEEVIYATLSATGMVNQIYAVNILNVQKEGLVSDYGTYSSVENLTSTTNLTNENDIISVTALPGRFYYQGNMTSTTLPWDINITYYLDSSEISADMLAGKSGHLEFVITTKQNKEVDSSFFEHYLLQVSVTLDTNKCDNIIADSATLANAGTDKLLTYTVMPSEDGNISISADVTDFEMKGIELSAVPFSLNIEIPDTSSLSNNMELLSDAITQLSDGMTTLESGVSEMNSGAASLKSGSREFNVGIDKINNKSVELINASSSISAALSTLSTSLKESSGGSDLSKLSELPSGLLQLSSGLDEISSGLTELGSGFSTAYTALSSAIEAIPDTEISTDALQKLSRNNPNDPALNQLLETYKAARTVKATYQMVSSAFTAVVPSLTTMVSSLDTISSSLTKIGTQLATSSEGSDLTASITQLSTGIAMLSDNYKEFHTGLKSYTGGISQLASSYHMLNTGITEFATGTDELYYGIGELSDGTGELKEKTENMPEQIEVAIDDLMADYDTSDYTPISFVSSQNTNVKSVQFVIKTNNIEKMDIPTEESVQKENENFWTRLKDLFV